MAQPANIFSVLKVADLATHIRGPAATTTLSDFGLWVIKEEPPEAGGPYRHFLCEATEPCVSARPRARNMLAPDMITKVSGALDPVASSELVQEAVLTAAAFVEGRNSNFGSRRTCQ